MGVCTFVCSIAPIPLHELHSDHLSNGVVWDAIWFISSLWRFVEESFPKGRVLTIQYQRVAMEVVASIDYRPGT
jgi:hypothetical protein